MTIATLLQLMPYCTTIACALFISPDLFLTYLILSYLMVSDEVLTGYTLELRFLTVTADAAELHFLTVTADYTVYRRTSLSYGNCIPRYLQHHIAGVL